jgi:hypothetical protein
MAQKPMCISRSQRRLCATASILAEIQRCRDAPAKRIVQESLTTFGTEIEAPLLIDIVADFIALGVIESFEDILDFLEVITILVQFHVGRIKGCIDFHFDDIPQITFRIERPVAAVTCIVDHRTKFLTP